MGRIAYIKLRSRKGASITFALLAFLVCAVISAVLLASASAAAGRLSGLADSDRRYYAVTSAVRLFCDELPADPFTVRQEHEETITITTTSVLDSDDGSWHTTVDRSTEDDYSLTVNGSEISNLALLTKENFWEEAALFYVFGETSITDAEDLVKAKLTGTPNVEAKSWKIQVSAGGYDELKVYALAFMDEQGNITMYFSNNPFQDADAAPAPDDSTPTKDYYVKAEFSINAFTEPIFTSVGGSAPPSFSDSRQVLQTWTTTTTARKSTVNWSVSKVGKIEKSVLDEELEKRKPAEDPQPGPTEDPDNPGNAGD